MMKLEISEMGAAKYSCKAGWTGVLRVTSALPGRI
ncbi:hypothetical protein SAMN05216308_101467 [Nitrosospira sp. Nsp13]|jgi:hypothetical protein|nr:hypothetical protein SAMN05216308_101467 [Nitrosospira sp. Nsp13]